MGRRRHLSMGEEPASPTFPSAFLSLRNRALCRVDTDVTRRTERNRRAAQCCRRKKRVREQNKAFSATPRAELEGPSPRRPRFLRPSRSLASPFSALSLPPPSPGPALRPQRRPRPLPVRKPRPDSGAPPPLRPQGAVLLRARLRPRPSAVHGWARVLGVGGLLAVHQSGRALHSVRCSFSFGDGFGGSASWGTCPFLSPSALDPFSLTSTRRAPEKNNNQQPAAEEPSSSSERPATTTPCSTAWTRSTSPGASR